jgi:hypothetical protein
MARLEKVTEFNELKAKHDNLKKDFQKQIQAVNDKLKNNQSVKIPQISEFT